MWFSYLFRRYLLATLVILVGLTLFYVGIDLLINLRKLPQSANLVLLYIAWMSVVASKVTVPLSFVFGALLLLFSLTKNSELIALQSLGFSRRRLIWPFATFALIGATGLILINASPLGYASQRAKMMIGEGGDAKTNDLLFRYNHNYLYVGTLIPFEKKATNVRIFEIKEGRLFRILKAQEAQYDPLRERWILRDVEGIDVRPEGSGINHIKLPELATLDGFRPRLLDTISDPTAEFNLADAFHALMVLRGQQLNDDPVRAVIYRHLIMPMLSVLLVVVMVARFPLSTRFVNITIYTAGAVLVTLLLWGVFMILAGLARSGAAAPELLLLLPFIFAVALTVRVYRRL
ncbi:MAG: LptF/LptG family permease [Campylobacterales bacterium]